MTHGSTGVCKYCDADVIYLEASDGGLYLYDRSNELPPHHHQCNFSIEESDRLKKEVLDAVENNTPKILWEYWKKVVLWLAQKHGEITADHLRSFLMSRNQEHPGQNRTGALFRGSGLEGTGRYGRSSYKRNKSRILQYWRLKQ